MQMMSNSPKRVLVTGATGNIGRKLLAELGPHVVARAYSRGAETAGLPGGVEISEGDLGDVGAFTKALENVDAVFLLWPFLPVEQASAIVEAIAQHGKPLVYLSAASAGDPVDREANPITAAHYAVEQLIEERVKDWTIVRPTAFASNTRLFWAGQVREGVLRWPLPTTKLSVIHDGDIAAVIARVILTGAYHGEKLLISGPEQLTPVEELEAIGRAIGRPLRFEELSVEASRAQMLGWGLPAAIADGVLGYWSRRVNDPEPVTNTIEEVTGVKARTFAEWAEENAAAFG
jgi:uncharacterized protein YbjT (DUF2867 family)